VVSGREYIERREKMKKFVHAIIFCLAGISLAAHADSRVVEMWQCELKEGKTMEEVAAANEKWLAFVNGAVEGGDIHSFALESIVGDSTGFMFADTFPSRKAWAAAKDAIDSPEGKAVESGFENLFDCNKNRLYKSTEH
jgi:hypothetical protein